MKALSRPQILWTAIALIAVVVSVFVYAAAGDDSPLPVEPDGGIGDTPLPVEPDGGTGETPLPVEPDGGTGETPMPVEPDGGIGDGAGEPSG